MRSGTAAAATSAVKATPFLPISAKLVKTTLPVSRLLGSVPDKMSADADSGCGTGDDAKRLGSSGGGCRTGSDAAIDVATRAVRPVCLTEPGFTRRPNALCGVILVVLKPMFQALDN